MKKLLLVAFIIAPLLVYGTDDSLDKKQKSHIERIAGIIYAESASEDFHTKSLVATVIWNRAGGESDQIVRICSIPKQFASPKIGEGDEWEDCLILAEHLYNGTFKSKLIKLANGEIIEPNHFFSGSPPWWARGKTWKKVGALKFLKLETHRTS